MSHRIIATFHPQAWVDDYAVDADPEGDTDFDVTDAVLAMGKDAALKLRDDQCVTDNLRDVPQAPQWVKDWSGPFYVAVAESIRDYFEGHQTINTDTRDDHDDDTEDEGQYINRYCHSNCPVQPGVSWEDTWSCMCNDRCPACNAEIEPYESEDEDGEVQSHGLQIETINDIGFDHGGTWIVNPTTSECSRFPASPDYYGFAVVDTGGGCTAWRKDLPDGTYLMLTDAQGVSHEYEPGAELLLGLYRAADDHGDYIACKTLLDGTCETTDDDAPHSRLI